MMKTRFWSVAAIVLFMSAQHANCADKSTALMNVYERNETGNRCTKLKTDANYFRAHGTSAARHKNTAKIKAQMQANAELSGVIQSWIKDFLSKYLNNIGQNKSDYMQSYEANVMELIEARIFDDIVIGCNKIDDIDDEGLYTVYLMVEIKRKKVLESLHYVLSADKNWKNIYDQRRLDDLFKAEISELKQR